MGIPDHLTCLLRNLFAGQEATVRTGHGTRLVPNRKRSMSRLYIVTLLIYEKQNANSNVFHKSTDLTIIKGKKRVASSYYSNRYRKTNE